MTEREKLYSKLTHDDLVTLLLYEDDIGPTTLRALSILVEDFGSVGKVLQRAVTRLVLDEHPDGDLI